MRRYLKLLGYEAKDKITGLDGTITSISFDLYGCVQAIMTPKADKDGKIPDRNWMDIQRLEITSKKPIMQAPDFTQLPADFSQFDKGPAEKPIP